MTDARKTRGAAPVGLLAELDGVEAVSVVYLRLWCDGPDAQARVWNDFAVALGAPQGRRACKAFEELCALCVRNGRRRLMRHAVQCKCLGADESCFANLVAAAAAGQRDDALMLATLLVRPELAVRLTALATDVGVAMQRMQPRLPCTQANPPEKRTLH